jgi:hypothetical protein
MIKVPEDQGDHRMLRGSDSRSGFLMAGTIGARRSGREKKGEMKGAKMIKERIFLSHTIIVLLCSILWCSKNILLKGVDG